MADKEAEFTDEQVSKLLRDDEITMKIDEWKSSRMEFHKKWSEWINLKSINSLSDPELKARFVEYYEKGAGRHPFHQIYRDRIVRREEDIKKFRDMLKFLLDDSIDIKTRINDILENNGRYRIDGVGKALVTSILFDFNSEKYPIWNNKVNAGLEKIGWLELKGKNGERYPQIREKIDRLKSLAPEPHNNYDDIDTFLHFIAVEPEGERALKRVSGEEITQQTSDRFELLEKTLRDFLEKNFEKIFPRFKIYEDEETPKGIEYTTGVGRIDILATNEKEILVIELKGNVAPHDALSQVLACMQWVEENLITGNKKVKGLIIAQDMDEKLKFAMKRISDVEFKKYKIMFELM